MLYPKMLIFSIFIVDITYSEVFVFFIQNISPVSGRIHPLLHDHFAASLTGSNILTDGIIINSVESTVERQAVGASV